MSLVIPDEFLQIAHISEADLKLEIAILLFQQEKLTLNNASHFAGINRLKFKQILASRKILIHYDVEEFPQDLKTLEANDSKLGQTQPTQKEILQRIEKRRTFSPSQNNLPDTLILLQEDRNR